MQCIVHQEAGSAYVALGERLEEIASETAPLVTAVTGLPLPDPIVIRTMTVRDWNAAHRRSSKRRLITEALELGTPFRTKARMRRLARLVGMRLLWPTTAGESVAFEPGHPEVVIVPEALQHAGRLDDDLVLCKVIAHEMTHLAQYAASGGEMWAAQESFFPDRRGTAERHYHFLVEGHAYWADRQITTKLVGEPVSTDEPSPDASDRYLGLFKSPARMSVVELQRRATDSVAQIIDAEGLDAFNQVWLNPDLVPLKSETVTPELWRRRFG